MSTQTQAPQAAEPSLESLCQQARALATGLPGGLIRLTVMAGQSRVEVEWQPIAPTAGNGTTTTVLAAEPEVASVAGNAVVAPLVGTFYRSSDPDTDPFVTEGDLVEVGQQVAIVEAMKIMNAVQTDEAGRVATVLVKDGDMVEFGQPLMIIEPADAES
jgi:acetyl-CoA carboxylase biotin carboxyl carrier protein